MRIKYKHVFILNAFLLITFLCKAGSFEKTVDGVIVYPDTLLSGNIHQVQLKVVADNIIRVLALPMKGQSEDTSLIIVRQERKLPDWQLLSNAQTVTIKTKALTVIVNLQTGSIYYFDSNGKKLLNEKPLSSTLLAKQFDGQQVYTIWQTFETTPDDAWYGLGQHQDGLMNYKSYQVQLFRFKE
jgi:alpha-D-xyloside xylohydrolase